jgi:hypothetical protein
MFKVPQEGIGGLRDRKAATERASQSLNTCSGKINAKPQSVLARANQIQRGLPPRPQDASSIA